MQGFRILYTDDFLVAIDKPAGFHTHPPEDKTIRMHPRWNALGLLERQLEAKLFPVHRLDRATSGVLLFSRAREWNAVLQEQFQGREVQKIYYCCVRGHLEGAGTLDQELDGPALTHVQECATFSLPVPKFRGAERIFTLVRAEPETGRFHQIRRHLAQAGLPILGDKQHGDRKLNRELPPDLSGLWLRCLQIRLKHPATGEWLQIRARWTPALHRLFDRAGVCGWLPPVAGFTQGVLSPVEEIVRWAKI